MINKSLTVGLLILLAHGWLALPARAESAPPSLEDRLERLEQHLAKLEERLASSPAAQDLAPTRKEFNELTHSLGWDGKSALTFVKPAGKEKSLALGGFMHAQFESGTAPDARYAGINNRFLLRRVRLNASGTFAEDFSFKIESDFGNNSIAPKTGISSQLTDGYISWTKFPAASLRLGQFKTPFGYEQITSDTKLYTIERSLPNDRFTLGRQIGLMGYGDLAEKRFSYALGAYNGTGTNIGSNDNQKFMWVARTNGVLVDTKVNGQKVKLSAGVDYFTTEDKGTFTGRREGTSYDVQFVYGPAEFQAELLENKLHPVTGVATKAAGWALLGAYNFNPKWQGVVRYESYDSNAAIGNTTTELWTFGINFLIKGEDLKLSLDYLSGRQPAPAPQGDRLIGRMQFLF